MVYDVSASVALGELKRAGVTLAMDDFGTGYSNLSYVKRLPVETLKIDRSYVRGLGRNAEDTAIVHATVAFAKALGLSSPPRGSRTLGNWPGSGIWAASWGRATTSRSRSRARRCRRF